MNKFSLAAAAVAAALLAAPASAQEERSVEVDISDLDTSTEYGVAELQRRIQAAARRVCGSPGGRTLAAIEHVMTCRTNAAANARRQ